MEELKFRQAILHPVTKDFWRWHYWGFIDGAFIGIDTGICSPKTAIGNSQQFTGLVDKNKARIYEGDIVKFRSWVKPKTGRTFPREIGKVIWHIDGFSVKVKSEFAPYSFTGDWETCEVIGNIYEGLLKGGNNGDYNKG